ncbi:4433_t:CDS:1, partial [Cetraspora pellucida]
MLLVSDNDFYSFQPPYYFQMVKILGHDINAPEPEELSFENENGTYKKLRDFIMFRILLNYVLHDKNIHPGDSRKVSKIASDEWKEGTKELKDFMNKYTKKVNLYRKNKLLPPFRTYKHNPKKVRSSKRAFKTEAPSKQVNSGSRIVNQALSPKQIVKTADTSKQLNSADMILNGIPPTPMERPVTDQPFYMIEGNNNVVSDYYEDFKEFTNVEKNIEGNNNVVSDNYKEFEEFIDVEKVY